MVTDAPERSDDSPADDVYVRRRNDLKVTVDVPLIGDAPDETLVERWSLELTVSVDPDHVFTRSTR